MTLIYDARLEVELLKPDGARLVSGPASVRVSPERLEIARDRGGPLLVEFEAIAGLRSEPDALRLLLDSGHDLRIRGEDLEGLERALSRARARALLPALALPDRLTLATAEADLEWLDESERVIRERAALAVLDTHLVAVPATQAPFAIPLARVRAVTGAPDGLALDAWAGQREALVCTQTETAGLAEALKDAHASALAALRDWLGVEGLDALAASGGPGRAVPVESLGGDEGPAEAILGDLEAGPGASGFLRALAIDQDLRVGVSVGGRPPFARVTWCLARWREGRSGACGVVVLVASRGATATAVFAAPADDQALERLCRHVDAAVCAVGLDLAPLRMRESDLPHYAGGGWLWPVRHFRALRVARRACRGLVPYTSANDWSQGVLTELADLRSAAGRAD